MGCELPVIVGQPNQTGGRQVRVNGRVAGVAFSLHDLTVFLQHSGLEDWDELDVAGSDLIEWRGGGPDSWKH